MNYTLTRARERRELRRERLDLTALGSNPGPKAAAPTCNWGAGSPRLCPVQWAGHTPRVSWALVNFGEVPQTQETQGYLIGAISSLPKPQPEQSSFFALYDAIPFRLDFRKRTHVQKSAWALGLEAKWETAAGGERIVTGCCYDPPSPVLRQLLPKNMLFFQMWKSKLAHRAEGPSMIALDHSLPCTVPRS